MATSPVVFHNAGTAQWIACSGGNWPSNAVEGGSDAGSIMYVARAYHQGALLPGKLHSGHRVCYVAWGGKEISVESYEVLVAAPAELHWKSSTKGQLVAHAVEGGHTENGEKLYIGRVQHGGVTTPGKIQPSHGVCYIPYGGKETSFQNYQILHG